AYALYGETTWLAGLFLGLKAAVLAIVIEAVMRIGRRALRNSVMLTVAGAAFVALFAFATPFPVVIAAAALAGLLGTRYFPQAFIGAPRNAAEPDAPSVIGSGTERPPPRPSQALWTAVAWMLLWAAPLLVVVPLLGWSNTFLTLWVF